MKMTYRHTRYTCYLSCAGHAIINNLSPLLFLTFHRSFGIPLEKIGLLISINFAVQMVMDFVTAKLVYKLGYRRCIATAQFLCMLGLLSLCVLPFALPSAYAGLVIAVIISGMGGGVIEVLLSPIVES
ncbi:MAG TPA: MFS transporter, partial [Clostridia bacterium]|nr:MFS transporter [Clostridia bacterium]